MDLLTLTRDECEALYEMIKQLSGDNPENVFAWDGSDDLSNTTTRASAKLYYFVGANIPENLIKEIQ